MPRRLERMFSITATVITASAVPLPPKKKQWIITFTTHAFALRWFTGLVARERIYEIDFKPMTKNRLPNKSVWEFWYKIMEGDYLRQKLILMQFWLLLRQILEEASDVISKSDLLSKFLLGSLHKLRLHLGVGRWSEKCYIHYIKSAN